MSRTLLLGLRLAVGGGREGLARLVFVAVGVGLGIALLLLSLTAPHALRGRFDRVAWQDAAYAALSPETEDDPVAESADGARFLAVSDYYDGRPMLRAYLAALGADPPVPPGLSRAPGPGEVAASPAMIRLLASTPDDELDARFPGRVTMTIGPAGLAHDDELVAIIGRTPEQLGGVRSVGEVHGFAGVRPPGAAITAFLAAFAFTGSMLVLVPIVILVVVVTRVAWRQREQRLAAIRLVGATQSQISVVAAAESGVAAVGGAALGWAVYEGGRRLLAATLTFRGGPFWVDDLAVPPSWLAVILLGAPALVMLATVLSLRGIRTRPLAVRRRPRRRRLSRWSVLPLVVGLGGQFVLLPFRDDLAARAQDGSRSPLATLGAVLTLSTVVGFVLVGPWLVAVVGRRVAGLSRSVPGLLAARRIAENPQSTFYSVAAVGLAAVGLAYIGCTVAIAPGPTMSDDLNGPWHGALRPGVVSVMTGGVATATVEPMLTDGVVAFGPGFAVPCADVARVLTFPCPPPPDSGFVEPIAGARRGSTVEFVYVPTDGSLAAENRVRGIAARPRAERDRQQQPRSGRPQPGDVLPRPGPAGRRRGPLHPPGRGVRAGGLDGRWDHRAPPPVRAAAGLRRAPRRAAPGGAAGDLHDDGGGLRGRGRRGHAAGVRDRPAGRGGLGLAGTADVRLRRRRGPRGVALLDPGPAALGPRHPPRGRPLRVTASAAVSTRRSALGGL